MREVAALAGPPKRENRANMATTNAPALPKAEAISTSSLMRTTLIANTYATMLRPRTVNLTLVKRALADSDGARLEMMLCEIWAAGAFNAACTTERMAETSAPRNRA